MLIDATHPEETRVVVTRGNRVEEFDYESATRKQLRGNIYLAKIARIEPSLQAAFVNYGGNRHGFLAFAEIHPDYYQIPTAVREAIMKEEALDRQGSNEKSGNGGSGDGDGEAHGGAPGETEKTAEAANQPAQAESAESNAPADNVAETLPPLPYEQPMALAEKQIEPVEQIQSEPSEEPGPKSHPIALEAILPPTIYEEFTAAVTLAEQVRDEIPAHPGDVEGAESDADEETDGDETSHETDVDEGPGGSDFSADGDDEEQVETLSGAGEAQDDHSSPARSSGRGARNARGHWGNNSTNDEGGVISVPEAEAPAPVEVIGSEDALEELPQRHKRRWRHYKIQEVIKRNQIVLIQVVKEERGTKGAALTTYLSLAGRYTVLMPNTPSGGGISRKITVPADRKRLKEIAQELDVPEGMGLIIRTAGASRTKAEIKRDFEYLLRLWENVRDLTLKSTAPCLVYEEGNLIKRSIRDLYNKDIDEIIVAGDEAHREAKEFMRMLMPSHAKNVIQHKDPEPLFTKYEVERQLNQMFSPVVTLKSGGYIVLNQTEALVAIDVNSGRATREYSIEDTALKTNMEASEEVARQVRLRDLAGLIVIDYIDMDERRNNRSVERKLKESLRHDRARIQVGHISHFGLLEMSRQRLRQGVVEVSTMPCPVCQGVGHIRSTESVALMILRSIEDHLRTQGVADITATVATEAALYILNHKRAYLRDIELRYGVSIVIQMDENAHGGHFSLARGATARAPAVAESRAVQMEPLKAPAAVEEEDDEPAEGDDKRPHRRKRRRRRDRGEGFAEHSPGNGRVEPSLDADGGSGNSGEDDDFADGGERPETLDDASEKNGADAEHESQFRRNRRRGRRGGRRHREEFSATGDFSKVEPAFIPGLGEQPVIAFDLEFPKNLELGPISRKPATPERETESSQETHPAQSELNEPGHANPVEPAPEAQAQAPAIAERDTVQAAAHDEQAVQAPVQMPAVEQPAAEVETETAETAAVESFTVPQAPAPKPRPVRSGPRRKGWWQRGATK